MDKYLIKKDKLLDASDTTTTDTGIKTTAGNTTDAVPRCSEKTGVPASPNNWLPPSPTVTPDESIIRQRGRKSTTPVGHTRTSPRKSPRKNLTVDLTQTQLQSGSTPVVNEKDSETPGRTSNTALRGIRKRLVLSSNKDITDEDLDDPDYPVTLASPPKKKKERKSTAGIRNEFEDKLKALSQSQIVDVVLKLVQDNEELKTEILQALPAPDISPLIKNLEYLRRNILKALPWTKYGSDRDAFCYRRCKTHVDSFKSACVSQGKNLAAHSWNAAMDYIRQAWDEVSETPDWMNESHCKSKQACYKSLAVLAKQAIKGSTLEKNQYEDFKEWLQEVSEFHPEVKPCIPLVEKRIQK
ncbi:hypothetical protein LOTGIDRAFT_228646 [Lottia gigantea]|uniref:Uncharacterized protein n=1 Tax=Lottia gigantea TaxID=225164 RepID=V4BXW6_LOTGI|nr:hypothetical protein LOTGIDRAFT_228646 [Lottia gigantea]ESO93939.1 hypothetical protein LOTGIDRAFT_228646 [Lottia gigantea]